MLDTWNWLLSFHLYQITQAIASIFGAFGLTVGLGASAWNNYWIGRFSFPRMFVYLVLIPTGMGQSLRAVTFVFGPGQYVLFIIVDILAAIITVALIAQYFGFLLKPDPDWMKD